MALNIRLIGNAVRGALRFLDGLGSAPAGSDRPAGRTRTGQPVGRSGAGTGATGREGVGLAGQYPGDFRGTAAVRYAPSPNGRPEPGEVVWTWVPFEEDHSQGKDRPVLLVGTSGRHLLGLMLTSRDHDGDARRADDYVDIGTGPWDRQSRPSEAKLDRILQINPEDVRREGAILDASRFNLVAAALRARHGWS
ncbi:MAG: type toxin-antitoxin system PemK/MazF family toxin [Arthrobacter sp.]|nr:type toxin-antitoxin system PemK/MazF family toxin [Arthrobacter sp.]